MCVRFAARVLVTCVAACALAQQPPNPAGVRELFYAGTAEKEPLPPIRKVSARPQTRTGNVRRETAGENTTSSPVMQVSAPVPTAARNLGLRYNLVLVDRKTGQSKAVSATRNFVNGECFALDIETNRSGYLYVLARQSSGDWMPLFPSPQMVNETNVVNPGQRVRVPARYCFEIADPPGAEKLFVALARDPREVSDLNDGLGNVTSAGDSAVVPPRPKAMLIADARLVNSAVNRISAQYITRDIVIREVAEPAETREMAHSVYVVNTSATPSSRVVTEVLVNHK